MEEKPPSLFRKQALEHVSSSQPLYDYIQIPFSLAWTSLIIIWLALIAVVVWLMLGQIGSFVEGRGILLEPHKAIALISAVQGGTIHVGMPVEVSTISLQASIQRRKGRVAAVDYVPIDANDLLAILNNQSLVDYFLKNGPVIKVEINLFPSKKHKNKLFLQPGMLLRTYIEIKHQKPIYLLISASSPKH